jgi:hypothetical protein
MKCLMKRRLLEMFVVALIVSSGCCSCSRSHNDSSNDTGAGKDETSNSSPKNWKPTAEAIENARRQAKAPLIVATITAQRASAYDLNPRAAEQENSSNATSSSARSDGAAPAEEDPALGGMEKLPPLPMPPRLKPGDEADQFGLPEWERMARGELHVKRIRY